MQQAFSTLLLSTFCLHFLSTYFQHFVFSLSTYYDHTAFSLYTQLHKPTFCCKSLPIYNQHSVFSLLTYLQPTVCFPWRHTYNQNIVFIHYLHPIFCLHSLPTFTHFVCFWWLPSYNQHCISKTVVGTYIESTFSFQSRYLLTMNILLPVSILTINNLFSNSLPIHNNHFSVFPHTYNQCSVSLPNYIQPTFFSVSRK